MELSSFDGRCAVMCGERCQTYWLQAKNDFWEVVKLSYKLTNWQPLELGCRSNISRPFEYFSQQLLQQKGFGKGCTDSAKLLRIIKFNKQRLVLSTIHSTLVVPNVQLKQSFFYCLLSSGSTECINETPVYHARMSIKFSSLSLAVMNRGALCCNIYSDKETPEKRSGLVLTKLNGNILID